MPGISLYDASVGSLLDGTIALRNILKKATESPEASSLPQAKLADDMYPLPSQILYTSHMIRKTINYLAGGNVALSEGKEQTLAELIALCEENIELLKGVDPKAIEGKETEVFSVQMGRAPLIAKMTGQQFALEFAVPNFFFHLATAYGILRTKGVPLGKMDYLRPFLHFDHGY